MPSYTRELTVRIRYRTPSAPRRPHSGSTDGLFMVEAMAAVREALAVEVVAGAVLDISVQDDREVG